MSSTNGRCNTNDRGSSYERRRRKAWLISPESGWGGDGVDVPCWEPDCGVLVGSDLELIADRIIPGERGGRYTRDNIAPHCALCSSRQGQRRTVAIVVEKRLALAGALS